MHPLFGLEPDLMAQGILRRVFDELFFVLHCLGMRCHYQNPKVVSKHTCVHQNRFFVESFWFLVPMFFKGSKMRFLV